MKTKTLSPEEWDRIYNWITGLGLNTSNLLAEFSFSQLKELAEWLMMCDEEFDESCNPDDN